MTNLFWIEKASSGINYKSTYVFKYNNSHVEISSFDRDFSNSTVEFWSSNDSLIGNKQMRQIGEEIKSGEHIRKFIKYLFESTKISLK